MIYVANSDANTISVIDGENDSVLATITDSLDIPGDIAINPTTNKIYVTTSGGIAIIDGSINSVVDNIALGHQAYSVAVNPVTNKIYAASLGIIEVIDGSTNSVIASLPQRAASANALDVNPTTNLVYATHSASRGDGNYVSVIDGESNTEINSIWVYCARGISVDSNTNIIYISQTCPSTVTTIDGSSNTVGSVITVDRYYTGGNISC
jgi:YVTN family beta-propeller protein